VAPRDLRRLCALLEARGQLHRIPTPVSAEGEIAEVADRVARRGGGALLFERVEGRTGAVLVDAFGGAERVAAALGAERLEQIGERLGGMVGLARAALAGGVGERLKALGGLAQVGQTAPRRVERAPCQQVVEASPSLEAVPVPTRADGCRALGHALLVTRDPSTGARRVAGVRPEVVDERRIRLGASTDGTGPAAVVLGADPATIFASRVPLPSDVEPLLLAGFLRRAPVELVAGRRADVEVPAQAEWVLEGHRADGLFEVDTLTHRREPLLPWSGSGRDERWLARAGERLFLPLVRLIHPEVVDLAAPTEDGFRGLVLVAVEKEYAGQPQKVIAGLFGMTPTMLARAIVVLDGTVRLDDPAACAAAVVKNVDWRRDLLVLDGPLDDLGAAGRVGPKLGVDATAKAERPARPRDGAAAGVAALVDRKWAAYGIPL
jgi:4-hydroxy-3-polyprenylbenzoate decarboxylase